MQRAAHVQGEIVGDIDQRGDRAQTHRAQAVLDPFRRRAVAHPPDIAPGEERAGLRPVTEFEAHGDRALEGPRHGLAPAGHALERAEAAGGEVARDAANAGAVAAIGCEADFDHRVVEPRNPRVRRPERGVGRQFDDPLMLVRDAEFALGKQHAVALDAANRRLLQPEPGARNPASGRREHAHHAGVRIRRAADDLHLLRARIHQADPQAVRLRMRLGGEHARRREGSQVARAVLDAVHLETQHGQRLADLLERGLGVEMVLQPGEGELHSTASAIRPGMSSGRKP